MSLFFGTPCSIDITIGDADTRPKVTVTEQGQSSHGKTVELFRYISNEDVKGTVLISPINKNKKMEHTGIKLEFIGQIELFYDRGNHFDFTSLVTELAPPGSLVLLADVIISAGIMSAAQTFNYQFTAPEKMYESYNGQNCRCRYFLRVSVMRNLLPNITKELDLWVVNYQKMPEMNSSIKMEVGIEECLHIEFEYNKSKYHLKDVVVGKVYFLLVRIKIKYMEISLLKRETAGQPPNAYNETTTLTKYEIMDGAPVKGESLPVRLFLGHFDLTPTYRNIHNKFSVKYFLNLVLLDEEDRRYFKQQEITLWRRLPKKAVPHFVEEEKEGPKTSSDAPLGETPAELVADPKESKESKEEKKEEKASS